MFTKPDGTVTYLQGMVPKANCPSKSALRRYDSTMACTVKCAFGAPDQDEWDAADAQQLKSRIIATCDTKSFYRVCKDMKSPIHPDHMVIYRN